MCFLRYPGNSPTRRGDIMKPVLKGKHRAGKNFFSYPTGKQEKYYRIYDQIYNNPEISVLRISRNTGIARNTISRYLKEMYQQQILIPPYLTVNPASNYAEYLYFLTFDNALTVFLSLKGFPNILSYTLCFGNWNLLILASQSMDFSKLGSYFYSQLFVGKKGLTITPQCSLDGNPVQNVDIHRNVRREIPWDEKEWSLFRSFRMGVRKKATSILKKVNVRYEDYLSWRKTVYEYCSAHTLFYPLGYSNYTKLFLLMETDLSVLSFFENWPASCIFTEVPPFVLAFIPVPTNAEKWMQSLLGNLQTHLGVKKCYFSMPLFYHNECG